MLASGNQLGALSSVRAGVRLNARYPITPATDWNIWIDKALKQLYGDDPTKWFSLEVGSETQAMMVASAMGSGGARVSFATSLPGMNNMGENFAYHSHANIPGTVLWNIQRKGTATGAPSRTDDGDLTIATTLGGSEAFRVVLAPGNIESFMTTPAVAHNIADRGIAVIGIGNQWSNMNTYTVPKFSSIDEPIIDRGIVRTPDNVLNSEDPIAYARLLEDNLGKHHVAGIPGASMFRGAIAKAELSPYDASGGGVYTEKSIDVKKHADLAAAKVDLISDMLPKPNIIKYNNGRSISEVYDGSQENGKYGLIVWSSVVEPAREAQAILEKQGYDVDILQLQTVHPITKEHRDLIKEFIDKYDNGNVYIAEQNRDGQLRKIILSESVLATEGTTIPKINLINKYDGFQMTTDYIMRKMNLGGNK